MKLGILFVAAQGDMPDRSANHTDPEDPSIAFQAYMNATSPGRQRDVHRFIVAFAGTVPLHPFFPRLGTEPSKPGRHRCSIPAIRTGHVTKLVLVCSDSPDASSLSFPFPSGTHSSSSSRLVDLPQAGRHISHTVFSVAQLEGAPKELEASIPSELRGPERTRTATALEAPRLDARRDQERPWFPGLFLQLSHQPSRLHTPHQPTTRPADHNGLPADSLDRWTLSPHTWDHGLHPNLDAFPVASLRLGIPQSGAAPFLFRVARLPSGYQSYLRQWVPM